MKKAMRAFSLLEMLIVVAIIGILSGIAYPTYSTYFLSQRRFAAKTSLFKLAAALENYFNIHDSYQGATLETLGFQPQIVDGNYRLDIEIRNDMAYLISAEPIHAQAKDTTCGTLSLTSLGEKNRSGTGNIKDCW